MKSQERISTLWLSAMLMLPTLLVVIPVHAETTINVVASEDSYVVQNDPASNFGDSGELRVKSYLLNTNTGDKFPMAEATGTTGQAPSQVGQALADDVATGATDNTKCELFKTNNSGGGGGVADSEIYSVFSFGIPADAVTILGIEVTISGYRTGTTSVGAYFRVRLDGGAGWTSYKDTSPTLTTVDALYNLGGSADVWGGSWTADSFSNANFRLEVIPAGPYLTGELWKLDSVRVKVYYTQNRNERSFAKFDLSSVPDGATITGAELKMTVKTPPSESRDYQARFISDDTWTETGITWNNQPAQGSVLATQATGTTGEALVTWAGATLLSQVGSERFGGDGTLSVMIRDGTEDSSTEYFTAFYSSEEAIAAKRPVLTVTIAATLGSISGAKFYDADTDGEWDAGEPAIQGWKVHLTGATADLDAFTGADGTFLFEDLDAGSYTVSEVFPFGTWAATRDTSFDCELDAGEDYVDEPGFGNVCLQDGSGGLSHGYWKNPGNSLITASDVLALNALNLYVPDGWLYPPFSTSDIAVAQAQIKTYLEGNASPAMAWMLSIQLIAAELSTLHGLDPATILYVRDYEDAATYVPSGFITIADLMDSGNDALASGTSDEQEFWKNLLDALVKNQIQFVCPSPCLPIVYP